MTTSKSSATPSLTLNDHQVRLCRLCGMNKPLDEFTWTDKTQTRRRGQCRPCLNALKRTRYGDPDWRPSCTRCGAEAPRPGKGGRRLCETCQAATYSTDQRGNGSHRLRLKPCWGCGGSKDRGERSRYCSTCVQERAGMTKGMRRFGITRADYDRILSSQGGVCAICKGEQRAGKLYCIDHEHGRPENRDAIRGLLCDICNYQRLSLFRDDPNLLRRAALYLEEHPAQEVLRA